MEAEWDLVIRGGFVFDGSGSSDRGPFIADIAVVGDRVVAISSQLPSSKAKKELDARGLAVCPGFIDTHTHDDAGLLHDGGAMTPKVSQGVTTVVVGNCGISLAPAKLCEGKYPIPPLDLLASADKFRFASFQEFVDEVAAHPSTVNYAFLVGHSTLRWVAMGFDDREVTKRPATEDEIESMKAMLEEGMKAGAVGMSSGLAYDTAIKSPTAEVLELVKVVAKHGGLYATHIRNEAEKLEEAVEEALEIGRRGGVPLVISHLKAASRPNFGKVSGVLRRLDDASRSQQVCADCYPYMASSTILQASRVDSDTPTMITWSNKHPDAQGRYLHELAEEFKVTLQEACGRLEPAGAVYFCMDENDVRQVLRHPNVMIGSDGLFFDSFPHPRLWGTFPRVIGHYVRDVGLMPLFEAVRKMTSLPADRFGLKHRGKIAVGNFADLVIFDPAGVKDAATFQQPRNPAEGIKHVVCNGRLVWSDCKVTNERPGRLLTRELIAVSQ